MAPIKGLSSPRLVGDDDPTPERIAEIEAAKARIRAEHIEAQRRKPAGRKRVYREPDVTEEG
jgi:hypothetical protein